jgi:glycine cleavage system H protein
MTRLILACAGLDKAQGSVAREVALRLSEQAGLDVVCPVVLNRTPARYKKALAEQELIVVDGCATRCASKLAAAAKARPAQKVLVSDAVKRSGRPLDPSLRLGPEGLELAQVIAGDIQEVLAARSATEEPPAETPSAGDGAAKATGAVSALPPASAFAPPAEFIVIVHDKYEFRIPAAGYLFNANDVWVRVSGDRARFGISDYMQQRLTDINYVDPPQIGLRVEQFGEVGSVESTKAVFELVSPATGTVVAVNPAVEDAPELINEDPYGEGWVAELELADWEQDRELLIDGAAYAEEVERKAAED